MSATKYVGRQRKKVLANAETLSYSVDMKSMILRNNGLDPKAELERHDRLAAQLRAERATMKNRNNSTTRDLINRAIRHEEEAAELRKEGVR